MNTTLNILTEEELTKINGGIANRLLKGYKGSGASSAYEAYKYSNAYKGQGTPGGYGTTWSYRRP